MNGIQGNRTTLEIRRLTEFLVTTKQKMRQKVLSFKIKNSAASLSQIIILDQGPPKVALMAKQRTIDFDKDRYLKRLKNGQGCEACGEIGHWWHDRSECTNVIRQKRSSASEMSHDGNSNNKEAQS